MQQAHTVIDGRFVWLVVSRVFVVAGIPPGLLATTHKPVLLEASSVAGRGAASRSGK